MELTEKCPYCGQSITRQQLEAIRARIRQEEQERLRSLEAGTRKQLEEKYHRELEAQKQALRKQQAEAILKTNAQFARERESLQRKIQDLERQMEKKTAHELGDGAERDLFEVLREAFREDGIQRVPAGQAGADVIHEVRYRGEPCGAIIYDSKNRKTWHNSFITKLKDDQAQHGAAYAVLASVAFPRGEEALCVEDGVVIVHPERVVYVAQILRKSMIDLHRQGLSLKERASKMAALYRFMSSGEFRRLLQDAEEAVNALRELDNRERVSHENTWKERARLETKIMAAAGEIDTCVTGIIEGGESASGVAMAG